MAVDDMGGNMIELYVEVLILIFSNPFKSTLVPLSRAQLQDEEVPDECENLEPDEEFFYGRLLTYSSFSMRLCEALARASCTAFYNIAMLNLLLEIVTTKEATGYNRVTSYLKLLILIYFNFNTISTSKLSNFFRSWARSCRAIGMPKSWRCSSFPACCGYTSHCGGHSEELSWIGSRGESMQLDVSDFLGWSSF